MDLDLTRWRADTPGCANRNHLNNAGAGLMPGAVLEAMTTHLSLEAAIGGYEAADLRSAEIQRTYDAIGSLVGAPPRNMAIVANATAGFIQAMSTIDFAPGDAIVTTRSDYTSYQIQFLALARRLGVRVLYADDLPEGGVDPDSVRRLISGPRVRVVHISWIPTHSGLVQDVAAVGDICAGRGIPYLIDACQAAGQLPIDVATLHCDYLSVTARKFLRGPRGIGFLYASDQAIARGDHPLYVDMRGATWVAPDAYEIDPTARRYEDWEFPYALVLGLGEAARYAQQVGIAEAERRAAGLAARLRARLEAIAGVRLLDRGRRPCAIVTAEVSGWFAPDLVAELRRRHINAAATLGWFGMLDLPPRGIESALRLSPHYYNTMEEVDAAADLITELAG